ncbi:signal peptidase I [Clostridium sp. SM-530-WT-3G]|uniref:signal peptidase I n=1 Tax=Clostridium sp. SM-530-WT-3G TaxID=2725303 RepID=UPI00145E065D|nr:signal peptidase I [Clostridium sp. SM-530-WT-3G]NME81816.1 signal peptidase I [Clostridium sp. SM-530-WT-3G]
MGQSLAVKNKKKSRKSIKIQRRKFFMEWIIPVFAAIFLSIMINRFIIINTQIPSESMVPTLNVNDRIIVTRVFNTDNIKRGDVIVFYSKELNERLIKRLIGVPGDNIEITDGVVKVNGKELEEDYVKENKIYNGTFQVPSGKFFFLGDNRPVSYDSRYWKEPYIDKKDIVGKAKIKCYPIKDFGVIK